jgi:hypothetical protein
MAERRASGKKKGEYKSPFEPIEDVVRAAEECKRLIEQGIITLELRYPDDVHFRIDEDKYQTLGKSKQDDRKFRKMLREEIRSGLVSALTGDINDSFPPPQLVDVPAAKRSDYKREAEAITDQVGRVLADQEVRSWYRIKSTAKNAVLQSVDWEINVKKADRKSGTIEATAHATVRLRVQEPKEEGFPGTVRFFSFPPIMGAQGEECYVLDMHERDIRNLIADLTKVLTALGAVGIQQ